ncbi:MAG: hypothetical protein JOY71_31040 [Acetobacteraceae bacterium]|nr:hypothetical protein [Acetobacteraceae bacterium]MBV8526499.1 hypothetical protein [Acetobacteraceae bacterium]
MLKAYADRLGETIHEPAEGEAFLTQRIEISPNRPSGLRASLFRSAKSAPGIGPDRVTTDAHDSYPRAIRTELGSRVRHRTSVM